MNPTATSRSESATRSQPIDLGSQALVSVVVATYNMGQYLGQAVESVLGQTYPAVEVHVVDDASTDDTAIVLARWETDPRVHVHRRTERGGQTPAKNQGIRASRGEFVAFCDADDYWLPEKLAQQIPAFAESPAIGVVYSREVPFRDDTRRFMPVVKDDCPSGRVTRELFVRNFVSFGTAVIRRQCLDELGPFDETLRMSIDWELWLRISTRYEFRFVDAVNYVYRVWPGQMSKDWQGRYEHCFRIMRAFEAAHPDLLDRRTVRRGWADSYASRARYRSNGSGQHWQGVVDAFRGILSLPTYRPAWRAAGRVLLNAMGRPL